LLAAAAPAFAAQAGWRQITVPGQLNAQAPIPVLLYYPTHEQETHMQCDREVELMRQRAKRLQIEIDELAARQAALVAERTLLVAKFSQSAQ